MADMPHHSVKAFMLQRQPLGAFRKKGAQGSFLYWFFIEPGDTIYFFSLSASASSASAITVL